MDRRSLLERLDAVQPNSDDLFRPEMAEARHALRDDPELAEEFAARGRFDAQITAAMRDVAVPAGLRTRLLQHLEAQHIEAEPTAESRNVAAARNDGPRMTRRGLLALVGTMAASLVAGGIYVSGMLDAAKPLALAEIEEAAARFLSGAIEPAPFDGQFQPRPPRKGDWSRLRFEHGQYGLLPSEEGHRAAAWHFSWNGSEGVLIAIPQEFVAVPPDTTRDYVGGNTVAWTEGQFVYLCRFEGQIDRLLRQIDDGRLA